MQAAGNCVGGAREYLKRMDAKGTALFLIFKSFPTLVSVVIVIIPAANDFCDGFLVLLWFASSILKSKILEGFDGVAR